MCEDKPIVNLGKRTAFGTRIEYARFRDAEAAAFLQYCRRARLAGGRAVAFTAAMDSPPDACAEERARLEHMGWPEVGLLAAIVAEAAPAVRAAWTEQLAAKRTLARLAPSVSRSRLMEADWEAAQVRRALRRRLFGELGNADRRRRDRLRELPCAEVRARLAARADDEPVPEKVLPILVYLAEGRTEYEIATTLKLDPRAARAAVASLGRRLSARCPSAWHRLLGLPD